MNIYRFVHLNVHSHYSLMNGCAEIRELVDAAVKDKMPGIALTDSGVMSGTMEFFDYISHINEKRQQDKQTPFKPIIGCLLFVPSIKAKETAAESESKLFHVIVLAKNMQGYLNLIQLTSKWEFGPNRHAVDYESMAEYRDGLIVLYGGDGSEAADCVMCDDMKRLDESIQWFKKTFGENFYIEVQRNTGEEVDEQNPDKLIIEQQKVTAVLAEKAKAFGVKIVATNNVRYVKPEDWVPYLTQKCVAKRMTKFDDGRWTPSHFRSLKSRKEMCGLFTDMPEAVENTMEIFDKVEFFDIRKTPSAPSVEIPESFTGTASEEDCRQQAYLEYLTQEKAKIIYGELLPVEVIDRLRYELDVIGQKKVASYFLFLEEVVRVAQTELDTWVGPGRSSAPGSLVCYCLGITKIDPLKYGLLFERFINPEKNIYPDIDLDFEAEGKERVQEWLKSKYGEDCCANVICFGSFIPSTALKAVAKARKQLTPETEKVIERLSYENLNPWRSLKDAMMFDEDIKKLMRKSDPEMRVMIKESAVLDNTVNRLGIHACAFVVSDSPVVCNAPVTVAKYKDGDGNTHRINCVEYENRYIEKSGLVAFDFLSLDALSQIKEMVKMIKEDTGQDIDIEHIPLDDAETIQLFQKGLVEKVFQFESKYIQVILMAMHPECFEDLTVINSLYRLDTLDEMRTYFARKKGRRPTKYAAPFMEVYLQDTYGVIVYQEQIMKMAQAIGGFTPGQSDMLRKVIVRGAESTLCALEMKFMEGGLKNGYKKSDIKKVWREMRLKGKNSFNKSHAVCYTLIGYQMGYLKTHFPEVFKKVMDEYGS